MGFTRVRCHTLWHPAMPGSGDTAGSHDLSRSPGSPLHNTVSGCSSTRPMVVGPHLACSRAHLPPPHLRRGSDEHLRMPRNGALPLTSSRPPKSSPRPAQLPGPSSRGSLAPRPPSSRARHLSAPQLAARSRAAAAARPSGSSSAGRNTTANPGCCHPAPSPP